MPRAERNYYIVSASYNLSWAFLGGVYPLFLLSRGLDLFQINAILAVFFIANFLFEVPTGAVADLFGRKVSFLLSCVIRAAAFLAYYYSESFWGFVGSEVLDALGNTLASGALDAWAVDEVREEEGDKPVDRLFARSRGVSYAAMIVSGLIGGYIAEIDIAYPWLAGTAAFSLTMVVSALLMTERRLPEVWRKERVESVWRRLNPVPALRQQIHGGLRSVVEHPTLRHLCLLTALIAFAAMPFLHFWPPQLTKLSGEGTSLMGWVWAILNVASLVGSVLLPRAVARFDRRIAVVALCLLRAVGVGLAAAAAGFEWALLGLVLHSLGMGASDPLLSAWVSDHANSAQRATVLSIQTMSFMLGGSTGLLLLGALASSHGITPVWSISALVLLAGAWVAWRSSHGGRAPSEAEAAA